ncbi:MAG TPA: carboxypeptidase-like regulatory domain-containing protein [Candidatus Acidoferrales bacterium]|nr:carboxypeptidase-like regulatory domain-containing protein [Candidatus Acidoferrales bacterium]
MRRNLSWQWLLGVVSALALLLGVNVAPAWAQAGSAGTVTVIVLDQSGGAVGGAQLQLQDLSTNDVRNAVTQASGTYSFVNLPLGTYKLTAAKAGFQTQVFDSVTVQAGQVTDLKVSLKVGAETQKVEVVESATPLIETTSNSIGTTVDMKQIEDLPLQGRNLSTLSSLVPGYNGTWNGIPTSAQGNNIDGVLSSESRRKFLGNSQPLQQARVEDIAEMTVETDQLPLAQGYGQSDMQVNFVTRRGTNNFHGRVYEDFQNSALNANSWYNDAAGLKKNHLILNDFGGSLGGPIIKNKLFFFGTYAESKQPGSATISRGVLTPAAQTSLFTYTDTTPAKQVHTVNLFTQVAQPNGLPATVNSVVAGEQSQINQSLASGQLISTADPNLNNISFLFPNPITTYFPTIRLDYNLSQNFRFNFAWNESKDNQPDNGVPDFPGAAYANQVAATKENFYTAAIGVDWTVRPTLVNQFRGGFFYYFQDLTYNADNGGFQNPVVSWGLTNSGQNYPNTPTGKYFPMFTGSDTATWQHGSHTTSFGFTFYREQDHYWNPPSGWPVYTLGLVNGDPALNAFANAANSGALQGINSKDLAEAEQLYAVLSGRVSKVAGQYPYDPKIGAYYQAPGSYNLDELSKAWGLFAGDSFRVKPTLTLNYGIRFDFVGDNHDLTSAYHSLSPSGIFGPSGIGNEFRPGVLLGDPNPQYIASSHQYAPWNKSPQPQVGIAWNPQFTQGLLGRLTGGGNTVVRAGFSLRNYTEPYQYFWDAGSDYGAFFYQSFYLNSNNTGATGTFAPGSISLSATPSQPAYGYTPFNTYPKNYPESAMTFLYPFEQNPPIAATGIDPHIQQPYVQSWNLGVQRTLGGGNAIEIRYVGSRSVHQWISLYTNETNIYESGFLSQFRDAQANLAINAANGYDGAAGNPGKTFADLGFPGENAGAIFNAAFTGEAATGPGGTLADYGNGQFIQWLNQGQAGAFASALTGIKGPVPYFCNLVTNSFTPCAPGGTANYSGAGGPYPINIFQANPLTSGQDTGYMMAGGYSTYNGLQVDFRQKQWHGMQFDVNYTWSHTLGIWSPPSQWTGQFNQFSLRDLRMSYSPVAYDIRHAMHASGTYDLPFGTGKRYLNQSSVLSRIVGGWTLGTIFTFQTGSPFQVQGGYLTVNDFGDGGVNLNGISVAQLQNAMGEYRVPLQQYQAANCAATQKCAPTFIQIINPKYLANAIRGGANPSYLTPNSTAGNFGTVPYLWGPHFINDDLAISKTIPIRENLRFTFQGEFLNVFNHPNFGSSPTNPANDVNGFNLNSTTVQSPGFGTVGGPTTGQRAIELRANLEF